MWSSVFRGRPADSQMECQNMAVSLKGCTSSFQEENRVLVFLVMLLAEGRQFTAAELIDSSKSFRNSSI